MPKLNDQLGAELEQLRSAGLYRQLRDVASRQGPRLVIDGRSFLNFSSNDYLGLADDPVLKSAATAAIERWGMGAGASRHVCGNLQPYADLERLLAGFKNKEAAIVFGSGYAANVGTITALVGEDDVVILDKLDHASIIDGARQSGATIRVFPHKNLKKLEDILQQSAGFRRRLIITETVFSMDGDLAPLKEIVGLKEQYDAWLMIDEAHATGLYGPHRRGIAEATGVEESVEITLGTLSKALGCAGGFVAGSQTLIDYLRNRARSLIYSTALPPAVVASAAAAVEFVMSEAGQQRRDTLWRNVSELKNGLSRLGLPNESRSAIMPVIVGDEQAAVDLSRQLSERGLYVPAIRYPTVPKGKARLRLTVTAAHTISDIGKLLNALVGAASPPRSGTSHLPSAPDRGGDAAPTGTKPHQSNLRKGRLSMAEDCYFITTCSYERKAIFTGSGAKVLVDSLHWLRDAGRIRLLGFVVMPDHLHVALALRKQPDGNETQVASLADVMQAFKSYTSRELKKLLKQPTPIWQEGYYDHRLRDRTEFDKRLAYMHDNPVRKGLVKFAVEYRFSTAHPDYENNIDWTWLEGVREVTEPDRGGDAAPTKNRDNR